MVDSNDTRDVVSLFSGAGGLDIGLEAAGWHIKAQVEMDHGCSETLRKRANQTGTDCIVIEQKIEDIDPARLRKELGFARRELALLAGGPPCQPFTTHGLRLANRDPRTVSLFPQYLQFVEEFRPKAILLENVDGMLSAALHHRPLKERGEGHPPLRKAEYKGSFLHWLLEELRGLGYSISWGVVEAADYGVPQLRQRAILAGVRGNKPCFLPSPTHGKPHTPQYRTLRKALVTVKELGPVQPLSERKKAVYRLIPPGGNWRDLPVNVRKKTMGAAFHAEGGKSGWWRRLAWDSPAPTILGMPDHSSTGLIHPDEVRCLSVNECAALQSFPPETRFAGSSRSQYQQIGNAVPPLLGEALGHQMIEFLGGIINPEPPSPEWRKISANRRIGTHGWVSAKKNASFRIIVRVRQDHIWAGPLSKATVTLPEIARVI